jgi:hypothetical protein
MYQKKKFITSILFINDDRGRIFSLLFISTIHIEKSY